ncbi:hypothetical protein F4810DRAFT_714940 [Camillea tinctor]|nr:hypothetical protein F4810DRAFT_714940 [Camillea tinctor]
MSSPIINQVTLPLPVARKRRRGWYSGPEVSVQASCRDGASDHAEIDTHRDASSKQTTIFLAFLCSNDTASISIQGALVMQPSPNVKTGSTFTTGSPTILAHLHVLPRSLSFLDVKTRHPYCPTRDAIYDIYGGDDSEDRVNDFPPQCHLEGDLAVEDTFFQSDLRHATLHRTCQPASFSPHLLALARQSSSRFSALTQMRHASDARYVPRSGLPLLNDLGWRLGAYIVSTAEYRPRIFSPLAGPNLRDRPARRLLQLLRVLTSKAISMPLPRRREDPHDDIPLPAAHRIDASA